MRSADRDAATPAHGTPAPADAAAEPSDATAHTAAGIGSVESVTVGELPPARGTAERRAATQIPSGAPSGGPGREPGGALTGEPSGAPDEHVGRYRIVRPLGKGGMGEVFLAEDPALRRSVAIKRILPGLAHEPSFRARLHREAQLAAHLSHRAIIQVFDFVSDAATDYVVMEYVSGPSLHTMVRRCRLPLPEVVRIAHEILGGLAYAHQHGVIHRDLKLENILIDADQQPKIADFGLAHCFDGSADVSLTGEGMLIGTSRVMSPEQAQSHEIDPRSDLFSLGVMLYELVTGTSPFAAGTRIQTILRVLQHRPPSACAVASDVPRALSDLIDHLLEKSPEARPPSALVVRDRLRSAVPAAQGESLLPSVGSDVSAASLAAAVSSAPPASLAVPASVAAPEVVAVPGSPALPTSVIAPSSSAPSPALRVALPASVSDTGAVLADEQALGAAPDPALPADELDQVAALGLAPPGVRRDITGHDPALPAAPAHRGSPAAPAVNPAPLLASVDRETAPQVGLVRSRRVSAAAAARGARRLPNLRVMVIAFAICLAAAWLQLVIAWRAGILTSGQAVGAPPRIFIGYLSSYHWWVTHTVLVPAVTACTLHTWSAFGALATWRAKLARLTVLALALAIGGSIVLTEVIRVTRTIPLEACQWNYLHCQPEGETYAPVLRLLLVALGYLHELLGYIGLVFTVFGVLVLAFLSRAPGGASIVDRVGPLLFNQRLCLIGYLMYLLLLRTSKVSLYLTLQGQEQTTIAGMLSHWGSYFNVIAHGMSLNLFGGALWAAAVLVSHLVVAHAAVQPALMDDSRGLWQVIAAAAGLAGRSFLLFVLEAIVFIILPPPSWPLLVLVLVVIVALAAWQRP